MNEFRENPLKDKDFKITFPDRKEKETPEEYYTRFLFENLSEAVENSGTFCNHKLEENLKTISKEAGESMGKNEEFAYTDHLTDINNRRGFDREAKRVMGEIKRSKENGEPAPELSLVFIDIDNFKIINDECGHAAGDLFLIDLSKLMTNIIRNKDILARVGGDELCLLLYGNNHEQANKTVGKIKSYLKPFLESYQNLSKPVDFSFGIAQWDQKQNLLDFVKEADDKQIAQKQVKKQN